MSPEPEVVSLSASPTPPVGTLVVLARERMPDSVVSALELGILLGARGRHPGTGSTRDLWEALATIAAHDLGAARAIEPHLDAVAILDQAQRSEFPEWPDGGDRTWGVFAAEGGRSPLTATASGDSWLLNGVKPWCSLAGQLDAALVTARLDDGARRLFAVDLHHAGIDVEAGSWQARGLTEIPSGPVRFSAVPAIPVGEPGWYLDRPGFSWGGIGVAACWFGGAVGLARTILAAARVGEPDPLMLMHLGAVDRHVQDSRRALEEAAALVDDGSATGREGRMLAKRVRATVANACEEIARHVGHALGPAPLALDAAHAKRVADLELYVRQHHAERDEASLGRDLVLDERSPW